MNVLQSTPLAGDVDIVLPKRIVSFFTDLFSTFPSHHLFFVPSHGGLPFNG